MNFDLNIDNYKRDELIQMFELPLNFDKNIVEMKESQILDRLIKNKDMNKETQSKTINFIIKAKNIILNEKSPTFSNNAEKINEELYNSNYELLSTKLTDNEHMTQIRDDKPYLSSYPSEYFSGVINPLKKKTVVKSLNIDTRFRDNYLTTSATNYNINLPTQINDVVEMQVTAIELPITYFVISSEYNNNYLNLTITDSTYPAPLSITITINDGNYDQNTIMDAVNKSVQQLGTTYPQLLTVSFSLDLSDLTGTGRTIITASDTNISQIEVNFKEDINRNQDNTPVQLKLGWMLGFRKGKYTVKRTTTLSLTSEGIVYLLGPSYFFLVVDDYKNNVTNNFYSAFNSSILNKNILARISLQAGTFSVLQQNNLNLITTPRKYFGPVNIKNLNIQLLDEYGRIVNLNNIEFSFCINLTTVYDI